MTGFHRIWGVAKADFSERVRRFSFMALAALMVFAAFWFVPRSTGFTALVIEPNVFLQGSDPSWVPMSEAMCGGIILCLFGFAYVKSAVQLDRETGVLSLLRASPLRRFSYLLGKLLSNTMFLLCLFAAIMAGAFLIMAVRFPGRFLSAYDFFTPFLCVVPGLVFVSAFALLTDCAPVFRKHSSLSIGIFFCLFVLILFLGSMNFNPYRLVSIFDFSGYLWLRDSISACASAATGRSVTHINVFTDYHSSGSNLKVLAFHGLTPSVPFLTDKLVLIVFSFALTALAALLLPRIEKAVRLPEIKHKKAKAENRARPAIPAFQCGLIRSELHMMLKPQSVFWWVAAAGLWIACLFSPLETVRNTLLPILFAWMLPVFSQMGCQEHQSGMIFVLRTIRNAPCRQALACGRAGLAISFFTALPALVRMLFTGDGAGFLSSLIFAVFVPSVALFLGEWTKTNRVFEILFLCLCFLMINLPSIVISTDFSAQSITRMVVFALLTNGSIFLALWKRSAPRGRRDFG